MTEDQVRKIAEKELEIDNLQNKFAKFGVGQTTTFNQLDSYFKGINDKPDGWYLPSNINDVAIVLEFKSSDKDLTNENIKKELIKNIQILNKKYKKVVGILYNCTYTIVYKNINIYSQSAEHLKNINVYLHLFDEDNIDKQKIYQLTKKINDNLHFNFSIKNLYHRMIFTACALVAKTYGALLSPGMNYETFQTCISSTLSKSLTDCNQHNSKLNLLLDVYKEIRINRKENQNAIDEFIKNIDEISKNLNSKYWNGEDVMGIFFNEFNRYKRKSESGQIFTPDHITTFMYRLIDCNKNDVILDAACGSGAFLVKAMCNMVNEVGGYYSQEAAEITQTHLYGIEFDREIFALACANMLIHKDGKTNLEHLDTRTDDACNWIKSKPITKVLMNPPYEQKYGCMTIVSNVLNNVPKGTKCAFILPDKKLEINAKKSKIILQYHTLTTIIKLPENLFDAGVTTSIFIFETGIPQNKRNIIGYYIADDGLRTVKNQGRHDTNNQWHELEDYWINAIQTAEDDKFNTKQIINPKECLCYKLPFEQFSVTEYKTLKNELLQIITKQNKLRYKLTLLINKKVKNYDSTLIIYSINELIEKNMVEIIKPTFKIKTSEYLYTGKTPIVSQEVERISGYSNETDPNIGDGEYICFSDHTENIKYIDFPFVQGADGLKILKVNTDSILPKYLYYILCNNYKRHNTYERHFKYLRDTLIPIPSVKKQKELIIILDQFTSVTEELKSALDAEYDICNKQYETYVQTLLTFNTKK